MSYIPRNAHTLCTEAARHDADKYGRCRWCGLEDIESPVTVNWHAPIESELSRAYRNHYDPDYGIDPRDR